MYGFEWHLTAHLGQPGPAMVHPETRGYCDRWASVSSLRDTNSASTWLRRNQRVASSNAGDGDASDGNAGYGNAGEGNAGDESAVDCNCSNGGAADPPPGPDHAPGGREAWRATRRQRQITELEFAKPIQIMEHKRLEGKHPEDFDTWWVTMQVYVEDQPEHFPQDERTIDRISSWMDIYAAAWHIHWIEETSDGTYPESSTAYINAL